jgi:lipid-A-disaccharide synthase-like uncharacterized protein
MFKEVLHPVLFYFEAVFVNVLDVAVLIGLLGQSLFGARFLVQWIASERAGRSVIPLSFWLLSIGGSLVLLGYALYRRDPVFILGQCLGMFVYMRNLMLITREKTKYDVEAGSLRATKDMQNLRNSARPGDKLIADAGAV